jgi:hypothetical protein
MSALDPRGPSQPTPQQAYETHGNPATKEPFEDRMADANANAYSSSNTVDQRIPTKQSSSIDDATPSSLGQGIRGAGPGEEARGLTSEDIGRHKELDADQMAAPGEGRVHDAVAGRSRAGASGEQEDLARDLNRYFAHCALPFWMQSWMLTTRVERKPNKRPTVKL